ncbi:hypothetical protein [Neorhodopirellula lusitana]|uniref:hypothetical protein n=1 Tax=Neorhodopirellula lusitana TaxID=445327 RepID=UPI00384AA0C5
MRSKPSRKKSKSASPALPTDVLRPVAIGDHPRKSSRASTTAVCPNVAMAIFVPLSVIVSRTIALPLFGVNRRRSSVNLQSDPKLHAISTIESLGKVRLNSGGILEPIR